MERRYIILENPAQKSQCAFQKRVMAEPRKRKRSQKNSAEAVDRPEHTEQNSKSNGCRDTHKQKRPAVRLETKRRNRAENCAGADAKRKDIGKITDLPTQTITAWMTLKPWEPLSVTLSEEARSSSYSNSDGSQKAAGFAVTHIRADYTLGHGFSVNASVNNLFDTKYAYSEGFIEEGRNFWAGIEYTF